MKKSEISQMRDFVNVINPTRIDVPAIVNAPIRIFGRLSKSKGPSDDMTWIATERRPTMTPMPIQKMAISLMILSYASKACGFVARRLLGNVFCFGFGFRFG